LRKEVISGGVFSLEHQEISTDDVLSIDDKYFDEENVGSPRPT